MQAEGHTYEVIAHRLDDGARWELDVLDIPVHAEVRDLSEGGTAVRRAIAASSGRDKDEISVIITLS